MVETTKPTTEKENPVTGRDRTTESTNYMQELAGIFFKVFGVIGAVIVIAIVIIIIRKYRCKCIKRKKQKAGTCTRHPSTAGTELSEVVMEDDDKTPQQESCQASHTCPKTGNYPRSENCTSSENSPPQGVTTDGQYIHAISDGILQPRSGSRTDFSLSEPKSPTNTQTKTDAVQSGPRTCADMFSSEDTTQDAQSSVNSDFVYVYARVPVVAEHHSSDVANNCDVIKMHDFSGGSDVTGRNENHVKSLSYMYEIPDVVEESFYRKRLRAPTPPNVTASNA